MDSSDIGYFPIYDPVIHGDARCDYVYNDTIVMYSHYDIRVFTAVMNDFLNVWTLLWITANSEQIDSLALLNIDALRPDRPSFDDHTNEYFSHYERTFLHVLQGSDFDHLSTLCVKRLIMQPRPAVKFHRSSIMPPTIDSCGKRFSSSLLLLWNSQILESLSLSKSSIPNEGPLTVSIFFKSLNESRESSINRDMKGVHSPPKLDAVYANLQNIISSLHSISERMVHVVAVDLAVVPFEDQVRLAASSSIIISSSASGGVMHLLHMPLHDSLCCALVEIVQKSKHASNSMGHATIARHIGALYSKLDLPMKDDGIDLVSSFVSKIVTKFVSRLRAPETSDCDLL